MGKRSMRHEVTTDEVRDTMNCIVAAEPFSDLQEIRYGYRDGLAVVFVKNGGKWFQLHTDPPNPTIVNALRARQ
jgi:hypothetical protein